jgi:hypothetical protein
MPYSCTSVLRIVPIYFNASVISVLYPNVCPERWGVPDEPPDLPYLVPVPGTWYRSLPGTVGSLSLSLSVGYCLVLL